MKSIIDNKIGKAFSPSAVFVGYVILVISLFTLFGNLFWGLGLMLVAGFVCFSTTGVQIDLQDKRYKEYTSYFNIKSGQWKPLDGFMNIAVLTTRESYSTYSRTNISTTDTNKYFDIYLLNKSHRQKLRISRHNKMESAIMNAKVIENKLGMPLVEYSPEISEKTLARRQK